jgi:hypothetical protein
MVEKVDATKAKTIAAIEQELNRQQADILQTAKAEIDALNKEAAALKINALQTAQAKAAQDANAISTEAAHLGKVSTVHQATGTTKITTETTAVASSETKK